MNRSYLFLDTSGSTILGQIGNSDNFKSFAWETQKDLAGRITDFCDEMLESMNLHLDKIDFFAICTGPGSLTGLRVGISFMRALAQSLSKPLIGIDLFTWSAETLHEKGKTEPCAIVLPAFLNHLFHHAFPFPTSEDSSKVKPELREITPELMKQRLLWIRSRTADRIPVEPSMDVLNRLLADRYPGKFDFGDLLQVKPMYVIPSQAEINLEKRAK